MNAPHRNWSRTLVQQGLVVLAWLTVNSAFWATPGQAYIGPGTGLSALGSLVALIGVIVVAIIGFVWFPMKRMMRKRKPAAAQPRENSANERPK